MWIRLLKPVDDHKPGDFLRVEEAVARAYIAAGLAEDGGKGPDDALFQRALDEFRKEMGDMAANLAATVRTVNDGITRPRVDLIEAEADKTRGAGDFLLCVVEAGDGRNRDAQIKSQERLDKVYGSVYRSSNESSGTAGGYTAPTQFENELLKVEAEEVVYLKGAREIPMGATDVEWPALDQYQAPVAGSSALFAGVQVYRKGESVQRQTSDPALTKVRLSLNDLTGLHYMSRNLLTDNKVGYDNEIVRLFGEALAFREDWEAFNGNGVGQFIGINNAANGALLTQTRSVGGHFSYVDGVGMVKQLYARGKKQGKWVMHPFMEADLLTLQDPGGRYIYIPNWPGAQNGPASVNPSPMLLGMPVEFSEKAPAPGSQGDVSLIHSQAYLHGRKGGIEIGLSEHFHFDTDEITFRFKLRNDAKPWLKKPIILADGAGTNKVSAFIVLV